MTYRWYEDSHRVSVTHFLCPRDECRGIMFYPCPSVCLSHLKKVFIINSYGFKTIDLKLCTSVPGILKMCTSLFEAKKIFLSKLQCFWTLKLYSFWLIHYREFV